MEYTDEILADLRDRQPNRCETCEFFEGARADQRAAEFMTPLPNGMPTGWAGKCRRYAPAKSGGKWPIVSWDNFCGDFKANQEINTNGM